MNIPETDFNLSIRNVIAKNKNKKNQIRSIFLEMYAVRLMLNYLYRVERAKVISKESIYKGFFNSQEVARYCDQNGIKIATEEGAKHRCPFLLNVLEAMEVLENRRNEVELKLFLVSPKLLISKHREPDSLQNMRFNAIKKYYLQNIIDLPEKELSILKEFFGKDFLTNEYFLNKMEFNNA